MTSGWDSRDSRWGVDWMSADRCNPEAPWRPFYRLFAPPGVEKKEGKRWDMEIQRFEMLKITSTFWVLCPQLRRHVEQGVVHNHFIAIKHRFRWLKWVKCWKCSPSRDLSTQSISRWIQSSKSSQTIKIIDIPRKPDFGVFEAVLKIKIRTLDENGGRCR
jgi:hypothetical protein